MMNRNIALVLALCMTLALVACGGGPKQNDSEGTLNNGENSVSVQKVETEENETTGDEKANHSVTEDNLKSFPTTDENQFDVNAVDGGVYISDCFSDDSVIVVPDAIDGMPVVGIAQYALSELKAEGIVLPDTVEEIEQGAFQSNDNLKYIYLGTSLKRMGSMPFNNCNGLLEVTFPDGMETFEDCALYNCSSITEIVVPDSVKNIPLGIVDTGTCPNAVVVTPAGSAAEADCIENEVPYRNSKE